MRDKQLVCDAYQLFEWLIADCERFHNTVPGPESRQFLLGCAAGLNWALGRDTQPFDQAIDYVKTIKILDIDYYFDPLGRQ